MRNLPNAVKIPLNYAASLIPKELYSSREFRRYRALLEETQHWNIDKILDFQNREFLSLVHHCYRNVPYYQELFDRHGIDIKEIKDLRDIKKIPFLDKATVKANKDKLLASNVKKRNFIPMYTGGTTHAPLDFYVTSITLERERAFFDRMWKWHGYHGQKCMVLRGDYDLKERLWVYNPRSKLITVNTRGLDDKKLAEIVGIMNKFKPAFIRAYPSIAYLLAKYVNQNGLSGKGQKLKTVFCASEILFDYQKEEIEKAFSCKVVDHYGHSEMAVLMQKCEYNEFYHMIPEYGITEIVDGDGREVTEENSIGEIVGTGFNNYAFPLLRYRTGDLATVADSSYVCPCGRPYRSVKRIDGRWGDFIRTKKGKYYSPTVLEFAVDDIRHFKDIQLVQKDLMNVDLFIVRDRDFRLEDALQLQKGLEERLDYDLKVHIRIVDQIHRPENQKHRFVISDIAANGEVREKLEVGTISGRRP
ncbi:MAG: phenylacetate--CoA ligase family protein [Clostridia bacterium]